MKPPYRDRRPSWRASVSTICEFFDRMLNPAPDLDLLADAVAYYEQHGVGGTAEQQWPQSPADAPPVYVWREGEFNDILDFDCYDDIMYCSSSSDSE